MQSRPVLNFKVMQQIKPNEETQRTQQIETPKDPYTPGLISYSATLDMDVTSPIVLEESRKLTRPSEQESKNFIGDYTIGKLLGKGAYGSVKLGKHVTTGERVAIKIINKREQKTEKARLKIRREIEILKKIKHPNLMECYGTFETD